MEGKAHDNNLFIKNGLSIHFYIPPGPEKSKVAPLITRGGGTVSSRIHQPNEINLCQPGTSVRECKTSDYILSTFVTDCVKKNRLLDMEKYRLSNTQRKSAVAHRHSSPVSDISDISGDDVEPEKVIIRGQARDKKGRKKYTLAEDMKILTFILEDRRYTIAGGNTVWKDAEVLDITSHTWMSMRDRYQKQILPSISAYQIPPFKQRWLTGEAPPGHRPQNTPNRKPASRTHTGTKTDNELCLMPIACSSPKKKALQSNKNRSDAEASTSGSGDAKTQHSNSPPAVQSPTIDSSPDLELDDLDRELLSIVGQSQADDPGDDITTSGVQTRHSARQQKTVGSDPGHSPAGGSTVPDRASTTPNGNGDGDEDETGLEEDNEESQSLLLSHVSPTRHVLRPRKRVISDDTDSEPEASCSSVQSPRGKKSKIGHEKLADKPNVKDINRNILMDFVMSCGSQDSAASVSDIFTDDDLDDFEMEVECNKKSPSKSCSRQRAVNLEMEAHCSKRSPSKSSSRQTAVDLEKEAHCSKRSPSKPSSRQRAVNLEMAAHCSKRSPSKPSSLQRTVELEEEIEYNKKSPFKACSHRQRTSPRRRGEPDPMLIKLEATIRWLGLTRLQMLQALHHNGGSLSKAIDWLLGDASP